MEFKRELIMKLKSRTDFTRGGNFAEPPRVGHCFEYINGGEGHETDGRSYYGVVIRFANYAATSQSNNLQNGDFFFSLYHRNELRFI